MKSYTETRSSLRTTRNANDQIISQTSVVSWIEQVGAPDSNRGNMVDPTAWNYTVLKMFKHRGNLVTSFWPSGQIEQKASGVVNPTVESEVRAQQNTVYNMALNRLNERVRGGLDLSIALAEAGTTKRMIRNTLRVLSHARRLKPPGGFGSTRDVANGYLQYRYGWRPLLGDVFDAADESLRVVTNRLMKVTASARIPEDRTYTRYTSFSGVPNVPVERKVKAGSFSGCKLGVSLEIPNSAFQLDRWTSLNPISIAWELIPYSFVVDWFLDIGSTLRNVETALLYNTQFRGGYKSEIWRSDIEDEISAWKSPPLYGRQYLFHDVYGELYEVKFNRTILLSYPFPRRPTFKVDLGSAQLFSAAALLRQLMPDKSQPQSPRRRRGPTVLR